MESKPLKVTHIQPAVDLKHTYNHMMYILQTYTNTAMCT